MTYICGHCGSTVPESGCPDHPEASLRNDDGSIFRSGVDNHKRENTISPEELDDILS